MRKQAIGVTAVVLGASALALTACGGQEGNAPADASTPDPSSPTVSAAPNPGASIAVAAADSELGPILAGLDGRALYGFTNDVRGQSTCFGTCAEAWPPVLVGPDWTVGPELDSGVFSTVERGDGTTQLVAGRWPLYFYAGDTAPGDLNGQDSGNVWFVVSTDAGLIRGAGPEPTEEPGEGKPAPGGASVALAGSSAGEILVDSEGFSLYAFTNDAAGVPTCEAECAGTWPAATLEGDLSVGEGLEAGVFSTVPSVDGGQQLKAGKWPLYRFSGDAGPGDTNGQGSGGVWFLVAADGTLVQ